MKFIASAPISTKIIEEDFESNYLKAYETSSEKDTSRSSRVPYSRRLSTKQPKYSTRAPSTLTGNFPSSLPSDLKSDSPSNMPSFNTSPPTISPTISFPPSSMPSANNGKFQSPSSLPSTFPSKSFNTPIMSYDYSMSSDYSFSLSFSYDTSLFGFPFSGSLSDDNTGWFKVGDDFFNQLDLPTISPKVANGAVPTSPTTTEEGKTVVGSSSDISSENKQISGKPSSSPIKQNISSDKTHGDKAKDETPSHEMTKSNIEPKDNEDGQTSVSSYSLDTTDKSSVSAQINLKWVVFGVCLSTSSFILWFG